MCFVNKNKFSVLCVDDDLGESVQSDVHCTSAVDRPVTSKKRKYGCVYRTNHPHEKKLCERYQEYG